MTSLDASSAADRDRLAHLHATGQTSQAAALAIELTTRIPNDCLAWKVLGSIHQEAGRAHEAQRCLETALRLAPEDAGVNNSLGVICLSQGQLDRASALFTQALTLQPTMPSAWGNLGIALHAQGDLRGAEARFRQALALHPDSPENLANLGAILQAQHRNAEARTCFERALAIAPHLAGIHCNLGADVHRNPALGAGRKLAEKSNRAAAAALPGPRRPGHVVERNEATFGGRSQLPTGLGDRATRPVQPDSSRRDPQRCGSPERGCRVPAPGRSTQTRRCGPVQQPLVLPDPGRGRRSR